MKQTERQKKENITSLPDQKKFKNRQTTKLVISNTLVKLSKVLGLKLSIGRAAVHK